MTNERAIEIAIPFCVVGGVGAIVSFLYAMTEDVGPRSEPSPPYEAVVVWRVLWSLVWPIRISWYLGLALLVTVRSCVTFVRWVGSRDRRIPRARAVRL